MHKAEVIVEAIKNLNQLEDQLKETKEADAQAEIQKQIDVERAKIPRPVQSHHDRIRVKGRPSVAPVRFSSSDSDKWICGNCFIEIPRGMHGKLHVVTDISLCESCGVYLYLEKSNAAKEKATA